ncbi:MAG: GNAT family N-acetyltransferase [Chloroflexota bacterium]|nr:GNAT family N-acetyltransferase [Chloroflexota bacterium]
MTAVRLSRPADLPAFEALAGPFLAAREAEHNLMLGICTNLRSRSYGAEPPYFAIVSAGDRLVAAALRTPPFNIVISMVDDPAALPLLTDDVRREYPELPGVLAEKEVARAFVELWGERTGSKGRLKTAERNFQCTRVVPPRPVSGRLRPAAPADRAVLAEWLTSFSQEALGESVDAAQAGRMADWWLEARERRMSIWEDEGRAASMCGASGETPNGIRIGAVYTPPELRGRGYASACVAALSQAQLDRGRRSCFLFTDLANPTSNKIYRDIGYEPVCDVDEYRFDLPPTSKEMT